MVKKRVIMVTNTRILEKTEVKYFGFFMLFIMLFSCGEGQNNKAKTIVEKGVEVHGGFDAWKSIKTISFDKTTILFNPDGSVESRTMQKQTFQLQPELKGEIVSFYKGINGLRYDGKDFIKRTTDSVYTISHADELVKARGSFFAAHYVICQPFELLGENAILTYGGLTEVDNKQCHEIHVSYKGDAKDANKWSYYFDANSSELLFNKVVLTDHTSWIENLTFDTSTGFKFNAHRKSYRLNEAGEKTYLRAEYFYENYKVSQ